MAKSKHRFVRRLRHSAAYILFRALCVCAGLLPRRAAELAGRALGRLFWLASPKRRRRATQNIQWALAGQLTKKEMARVVKQSFIHMGLTAMETLWADKHDDASFEERFPVEGVDAVKAELAKGRGVLAFTLHLGNWEIFGSRMARVFGEIAVVALPGKNRSVSDYIVRVRERMGLRVISSEEGVRPMARALKNGSFLAILIDRHVDAASVRTKFFGRDAATTSIVAALARRLDVPVFLGYSVRSGHSFRHRGFFEGPLELIRTHDHESDVRANTQRFNDRLEVLVRRHPEQWLWIQKRWKLAKKLRRERQRREAAEAADPAEQYGQN